MDEQVYTISQVAKTVGESTSVLRYWEDVLEIRVNRNPKGYRCYTGYDIQLFLNIKELKKRGLKLDAIRELIPRIYQYGPGAPKSKTRLLEDSGEEYTPDFEDAENQEMQSAEIWDEAQVQMAEDIELEETQEIQEEEHTEAAREAQAVQEAPFAREWIPAGKEPEESVHSIHRPEDFRMVEFQNILEKLIAQGMKEKNQEELRIRKLDEKIRFHQQGLKQVAAAQEMKQWRGRGKRRKK